jgi:hypothetical protein
MRKWIINSSTTVVLLNVSLGMMSISSCVDDHAVNPSELSVTIIPLKTGNTWTRHQIFLDSLQTVLRTFTVIERIYGDTVIMGERWFGITSSFNFIVTNRADGFYFSNKEVVSNTYKTGLQWKYPALPGQSFYSISSVIEVVSSSDIVTTSAGTFECYKYRWEYLTPSGDSVTGHVYAWLCPNVGIVKMSGFKNLTAGKEYLYYTEELSSFTVQ